MKCVCWSSYRKLFCTLAIYFFMLKPFWLIALFYQDKHNVFSQWAFSIKNFLAFGMNAFVISQPQISTLVFVISVCVLLLCRSWIKCMHEVLVPVSWWPGSRLRGGLEMEVSTRPRTVKFHFLSQPHSGFLSLRTESWRNGTWLFDCIWCE